MDEKWYWIEYQTKKQAFAQWNVEKLKTEIAKHTNQVERLKEC